MPATSMGNLPAEPRSRTRGKYAMWLVLAIVLLASFVPPWINVNRYRGRVVATISRALGREVSASGIEMRLLPRPGLVLSGFVVADDPAYSAEPMLRAETVAAYVRMSSLWRGRLEIGTLELDNPSLNLVRRPDGHWNVEEVLQRSSQASPAPTAARRPESRPRFPYVEATTARINFKLGTVKKAFSFTDADFALWRESEKEWGIRMQARPTRTDLALSDTGQLKVDGRFQSAPQLRKMPVRLQVQFSKGQLGQITKLIYGRDRGWRGGASATATLSGTPAALSVVLDAQIDDFRRYDIALGEALRLRAHCTGAYSVFTESLDDVVCDSPVKPGLLRVSGGAKHWGAESYQIAITAQQLPMERLIAFARHAKKDLPTDLVATGEVEATFEVRKTPAAIPFWSGGGRTSRLVVQSGVLSKDLEIGQIEFAVPGGAPSTNAGRVRKAGANLKPAQDTGFSVVFKPFALLMGAPSPAVASAFVDEDLYRATISGEAELKRLVEIAKALGIGVPGIGLAGKAQVELELSGEWVGFAPPAASGQMQLSNVVAELQGVNEPLQIASATATLSNHIVNVGSFSGAAFGSDPAIAGSASFPVHCTAPETCIVQFNLHSDELSLARINQLLNPAARSQPWYRLLAIGQQHDDALLKLRAGGKFNVARLQFGPLPASNVAGEIQMNAGKVRLDVLRSDLLGGHHNGRWTADFTQSPPRFAGGGTLQKIAMDQLSALMHDNWAAGQISGKFRINMQGANAASLRNSLAGSLDFVWTGGSLRHVTLEGRSSPLTFASLAGVLEARQGKLLFNDCKMKTAGLDYTLTGTAAYDRSLDLHLQREGGPSYAIAGPLDKPRVEALPSTSAQAHLR